MPDQSIMDSIVHIISAIGIIVAALSSIWNHVKIRETSQKVEVATVTVQQTAAKVEENTKAIAVVHEATNSMKDELVASVREEARAAGVLQGHAEAQHGINTGSVK